MASDTNRITQALADFERDLPARITATLTAAAERMQADARAMIGTEPDIWPALATATIAEKARQGFTGHVTATDPLLRTGALRQSITADADADGITLASDSDLMPYFENGTDRMPPRPVLAPTMAAHAEEIAHAVAGSVSEALRSALRSR
jgi:hypothetical protein